MSRRLRRIETRQRLGLFRHMPLLSEAVVHVDPWSADPDEYHRATLQREPVPGPIVDV